MAKKNNYSMINDLFGNIITETFNAEKLMQEGRHRHIKVRRVNIYKHTKIKDTMKRLHERIKLKTLSL